MRIITLLILTLLIPVGYAIEDQFTEHLGKVIFETCKNADIELYHDYIIDNENDKAVREIEWPYTREGPQKIAELYRQLEPFAAWTGDCENAEDPLFSSNGCKLLTCGANRLDASQDSYFMNDVLIELPRPIVATTQEPEIIYVESESKTWIPALFIGLGVGIIVTLVPFLLKHKQNKKTKLKSRKRKTTKKSVKKKKQ